MGEDVKLHAAPAAIREAEERDIPAIAAIYAHHVEFGLASFEEIPPDVEEIKRRFHEVQARGLPYLVAELQGKVVGYAYAAPYRLRSAYRYTLEDSIYLGADFTGLGIGKALLQELIRISEERGYRQMIAVIGDSNHRPSIRLHESLGFRHAGLLPSVGFKFGRWVDSVFMQRPLGPGDTVPAHGDPEQRSA